MVHCVQRTACHAGPIVYTTHASEKYANEESIDNRYINVATGERSAV